jgi:hypothetical protein
MLTKKQKKIFYIFLGVFGIGLIIGLIFLLRSGSTNPVDPVIPPDKCRWGSSNWGECDPTTNTQTRDVNCVKSDGSNCDKCIQSDKPSTSQVCTPMPYCCDSTKKTDNCTHNISGCGSLTPISDCGSCHQIKWPSNVYFFEPGDEHNIQKNINNIFKKQGGLDNNGQFSKYNYALLFAPGQYINVDIPIGYYTHVAGLGRKMEDVVINGKGPHVDNSSTTYNIGSLNNFWRSCENMKVVNPSDSNTNQGTMIWSVSQAASLRSMDIKGNLQLFAVENGLGGYASGGFLSNVKANVVTGGSQQQFICRNSTFDSFVDPLWNQVLVGCNLSVKPAECCIKEGSGKTLLYIEQTPVISEKPYLVQTDSKKIKVLSIIKPPKQTNSSGQSLTPINNSVEIKEDGYFIAIPGVTSTVINEQLQKKKDIIFCPGIYYLEETINLKGQLLFGLGVPRIISNNSKDIVQGHGDICGIIFEAGSVAGSTVLVNMKDTDPSNLWDVYCRVGGGADKTKTYSVDKMLYVGGNNSVVDNCWCWVADHYEDSSYTGWDKAACNTGVHITGNNVICYGMFSEHNHNVNLQWDGDNGEMYMFQSELNYFPKNQDAFKKAVSYKINEKVKKHKIRGAGAYCFFPCSSKPATDIYALAGFLFPTTVKVDYKTVFTVYLNGYGGINNVIVDEYTIGDGYKVGWAGDGKPILNNNCNPSFKRSRGNTMLKYQCNPDNCSCVGCQPPSICTNGNCIPQGGCSDAQKATINKVCKNGCNCGTEGSLWKCTTKNQAGCYNKTNALLQCNSVENNICKWW